MTEQTQYPEKSMFDEAMQKAVDKILETPESSLKFLQRAGILDEEGNLAKVYREEKTISYRWN